jgi:hypothetical protein
MQLKTKAGIALVVLGIAISGVWSWWTKSRTLVPVSLPVPLVAGQSITSEFKLNFDGVYLVAIEADKAIPLDELRCRMDVDADPQRCKSMPSVIASSWVLSSDGRDIAHGSSLQQYSSALRTNGVARVIGDFPGNAGQHYKLHVTFAAGAGGLAAAHPRLKVAVASIAYTDLQSASMLVLSTVFICELFGVILLGIAYFAKKKPS